MNGKTKDWLMLIGLFFLLGGGVLVSLLFSLISGDSSKKNELTCEDKQVQELLISTLKQIPVLEKIKISVDQFKDITSPVNEKRKTCTARVRADGQSPDGRDWGDGLVTYEVVDKGETFTVEMKDIR